MISNLLPDSLRDFLPYFSPSAWQVISKSELFLRMTEIARHRLNSDETAELKKAIPRVLPATVRLTETLSTPLEAPEQLSDATRVEIGESILDIYFSQLYNPSGLFCDLRLRHFSWHPIDHGLIRDKDFSSTSIPRLGTLEWAPPSYWFCFDPGFRAALLLLYDGYYLNQLADVEQAIVKLGLVPHQSRKEDIEAMRDVFRKHFGPGDQRTVRFSLAGFRSSFHDIFDLLIRMHHQIPVDFALLGIYLVGMYWALEKLDVALDIRKVYLRVRERLMVH